MHNFRVIAGFSERWTIAKIQERLRSQWTEEAYVTDAGNSSLYLGLKTGASGLTLKIWNVAHIPVYFWTAPKEEFAMIQTIFTSIQDQHLPTHRNSSKLWCVVFCFGLRIYMSVYVVRMCTYMCAWMRVNTLTCTHTVQFHCLINSAALRGVCWELQMGLFFQRVASGTLTKEF